MSDFAVQGYNLVASGVEKFSGLTPIKFAFSGLEGLSNRIDLKFFKDFMVKPFMLAGVVQKFTLGENTFKNLPFSGIKKIAAEAGLVKTWLCMPDFLLALPKVITSFKEIKEIKDGDLARKEFLAQDGKSVATGLKLSQTQTVFKRLFGVATSFILFGDDVSFAKNYVNIPKRLEKVTPWIQTGAGIYMGIQGSYQEYQLRQNTDFSKHHFSENYLSMANLAMSVSYLFYGVFGLAGLYLGDKGKDFPLLSKCQFIGSCGVYLVPMVQYCFEQYRNSFDLRPKKQD